MLPSDVKALMHPQLVDDVGHHYVILSNQLQQHLKDKRRQFTAQRAGVTRQGWGRGRLRHCE
jgi:hypothetical protein